MLVLNSIPYYLYCTFDVIIHIDSQLRPKIPILKIIIVNLCNNYFYIKEYSSSSNKSYKKLVNVDIIQTSFDLYLTEFGHLQIKLN